MVERTVYWPFGNADTTLSRTGITAPAESHGYIGERLDTEAGRLFLNGRNLDPKLGLFTQPDWFEVTKPGVGTNRYAYAGDDPVNGSDPGGNSWLDRGWDAVFGSGSFNSTFGDSGSAWSDRAFGDTTERASGSYYKQNAQNLSTHGVGYDQVAATFHNIDPGSPADEDFKIALGAGAGVVAGGVAVRGAWWLGEGAINSLNTSRVFLFDFSPLSMTPFPRSRSHRVLDESKAERILARVLPVRSGLQFKRG